MSSLHKYLGNQYLSYKFQIIYYLASHVAFSDFALITVQVQNGSVSKSSELLLALP